MTTPKKPGPRTAGSKPKSGPKKQKQTKGADGEVAPKSPRARKPRKPRAPRKPQAATDAAASKPTTAPAPSRSWRRRVLVWGLKLGFSFTFIFVLLSSAWILTYRYVNPPLTPLMLLRHVQEEEDVRKRWRAYDEIAPEFLLAVVAAEDQLFFKHDGFDFKQIRAAIQTRLDGGRLRGGSTISQQVAKNVFLWPGRSWLRKGLEVWYTVGIEFCWGKQRILEVYVNIAEMGQGIYGVEAAAQHYYGKPASDLSRAESALLAAVLPAPRDRSPLQPTAYLQERQAWILGQMHNLGGPAYLEAR